MIKHNIVIILAYFGSVNHFASIHSNCIFFKSETNLFREETIYKVLHLKKICAGMVRIFKKLGVNLFLQIGKNDDGKVEKNTKLINF